MPLPHDAIVCRFPSLQERVRIRTWFRRHALGWTPRGAMPMLPACLRPSRGRVQPMSGALASLLGLLLMVGTGPLAPVQPVLADDPDTAELLIVSGNNQVGQPG